MTDYLIVVKTRTEFQKLLNQWKHQYKFEVIWMNYDIKECVFRALIKRERLF